MFFFIKVKIIFIGIIIVTFKINVLRNYHCFLRLLSHDQARSKTKSWQRQLSKPKIGSGRKKSRQSFGVRRPHGKIVGNDYFPCGHGYRIHRPFFSCQFYWGNRKLHEQQWWPVCSTQERTRKIDIFSLVSKHFQKTIQRQPHKCPIY